ncbi:sperm flagellar membrane protein [Nymphon striatum]|nr:sperm flagellar membrane protein [Nymphon striatum]
MLLIYLFSLFAECQEVDTPNSFTDEKFLQQTSSESSAGYNYQISDTLSLDFSNSFPRESALVPATELFSSFSSDYYVHPSSDSTPSTELNNYPVTTTATVFNTEVLPSFSVYDVEETSQVVQPSLSDFLDNAPIDGAASFSEISYEQSDLYSGVNTYPTESISNYYDNENERTDFVDHSTIVSFVGLESSSEEVGSIMPVSVDESTVSPTIFARSVDMPNESEESSVAVAEDRFGVIEDEVDNSADSLSKFAQLHPLDLSGPLRVKVNELKKETRQNNPSIEHIISGLVGLLGGNVKTNKRLPHRRPRPPYRRPSRLPLQPRPSLVKVPSFVSPSRINHRGPSKFNGIRPGVNFGVQTNPNYTPSRPSPTSPSVYFSTKQKPNRWEWSNFADQSASTSEIVTTSSETVIKTSSVSPFPNTISPSSTKSGTTHSQLPVLPTPPIVVDRFKTPVSQTKKSSGKPVVELTVTFDPTFTLSRPSTDLKPSVSQTSKPTKTAPTLIKIKTPSVIKKVPVAPSSSLNKIEQTKTSAKNIPSISSTKVSSVRTATKVVLISLPPSFSSIAPQDPITKEVIKSSVITKPQVASSESVLVPSSSISKRKPVSDLSDKVASTKVRTSSSEISIITAPNVMDITVTNKIPDTTKSPKPIIPTRLIVPTKSKKPTTPVLKPTRIPATLPTPFLPSIKSTKKPAFTLNNQPRPAPVENDGVITLSGEGSFKPSNNRPTHPKRLPTKIPTRNNKPSLVKKPNPSRPSSIGRPTVIPVEIDEFRDKPSRNIFQNRRPGSGNAQVVGSGIRFGGTNADGLRPARPARPPSRPRPKSNYKPNLPPLRIDTCVVGEDSTCDHKLNEQCRTEQGVSSCICRPGFARTGSRGPCFSVVSLATSIRIDRYGPRRISFNRKLLDKTSDQYKILREESQKAVNSVFRYSKFRGLFYGSTINKFYPMGGKVVVNATFTLEKNPDTLSDNIRQKLQRELIRVIANRNQNIGDSVLYVDGPLNPVPGVQDVNECSSPEYNDCGENSECENIFGSFECNCVPGYIDKYPKDKLRSGRHCSTCPSSFCNNHGDCVVKGGKQECVCKGSYIGDKCETDGEVLGVALGVSVAAVIIIILTLVCLCNWSRRWRQEEQKMDRASGRTSGSSGNTFTYIDKSGNNAGQNPYMDDRLRWPPQMPDAVNNYYGSEPVHSQPMGNPSIYGGLFPPMSNASRPMTPKSPKHLENQYHVPRPRSRAASLSGSGMFYDSDYSRDIYNNPGGRNSGYAIPLRPMRS